MTNTHPQMMPIIAKSARAAAVLGLVLLGMASINPARADDDDDRHDNRYEHYSQEYRQEPDRHEWREHEEEWHDHEQEARHWHRHHYESAPSVVYAPPAVFYAPPAPPSGINLIIPLNIR